MITWLAAAVIAGHPLATESTQLSQRQLDAISAHCNSPRSWLRNRKGVIHLRPSRTANYEKIDCVLGQLKSRHAGPMGFIGNETFAPEKSQ